MIKPDFVVEFKKANSKSVIVSIAVESADTPEKRRVGLMNRKLADYTLGILFTFEYETILNFWMHDTPSSLDIIFVDELGVITDIAKNTKPMSDTHYESKRPAKYVVEVLAGFCEKYKIVIRDSIRIRLPRSI